MGISKVFLAGVPVTELYDKIVTELDRGIDTATIKLPASVFPHQNDEVLILKDLIDLTGLRFICHFENNARDESGYGNDLTVTSPSYVDGKFGKAIDCSIGDRRIADNSSINLNGKRSFSVVIYAKSLDSTQTFRYLAGKGAGLGVGVTGHAWDVLIAEAGRIRFRIKYSTSDIQFSNTSTGVFNNDGQWHCIICVSTTAGRQIYFDKQLLVNSTNVQVGQTIVDNGTGDFTIGNAHAGGSRFVGPIDTTRFYVDRELTQQEVNGLSDLRFLISTIKFGGNVSSIDDNVHPRTVECKSLGNQVGQTKVQNKVYNNQTVDDIVEDLISTNTTLTFVKGASTQMSPSLTQFTATGYLIDLVNALAGMGNKTFFTDGLGQFHWDDNSAVQVPLTYTHGSNAVITISGKDDTQLANRITVQGQDLEYQNTETFTGDGSTTVFATTFIITNALVLVNGVVQIADQDYSYNTQNKQITFVTAPAVGASISVQYTYDKPISIQCVDQPSIDANGVYDKDLPAPWITTTGDATRFGQLYLQAFKDVKLRVTVQIPRQDVQVASNLVVYLVNSIKAINGTFVIKSVTWEYPGITTLDCGEFTFSDFELHKQVLQALHSLQQLTASSIQLTNFKNIPENMAPVETVTKKNLSLAYYNNASYYSDSQVYSE